MIEAYSRGAVIEGMKQPHVCGIMLQKGIAWSKRFRVTSAGHVVEYCFDRWDDAATTRFSLSS